MSFFTLTHAICYQLVLINRVKYFFFSKNAASTILIRLLPDEIFSDFSEGFSTDIFVVPWCSGYHYYITSFNED